MAMTILYPVGKALYINLTNRCPNSCDFCVRTECEKHYGSTADKSSMPARLPMSVPCAATVRIGLSAWNWLRLPQPDTELPPRDNTRGFFCKLFILYLCGLAFAVFFCYSVSCNK